MNPSISVICVLDTRHEIPLVLDGPGDNRHGLKNPVMG